MGWFRFELIFLGSRILIIGVWRQTLILPAGQLELEYVVRSEEITTDQGIYLEIKSYPENRLLARSDMIRGTHSWRKLSLSFQTDRPMAAHLTLLRSPSRKFDNLLGGSLWLDEIKIGPVEKDE